MSDTKKPNVVIIMADQLRYDVVNEKYAKNISALRSEGVSFTRAYCASPLCVPARGSFFTGCYPNETGSIINGWFESDAVHGDVRSGIDNLYRLLETDWDSWHTGKQHLNTAGGNMDADPSSKTTWATTSKTYGEMLKREGIRHPGGAAFKGLVPEMVGGKLTWPRAYSIPTTGCFEYGLDYFYDGYFKNGALRAIRERDKNKPLLLNAMFIAPHPPFDIPKPWYDMYANDDSVVIPENVGKWYREQSPLQMHNLTGFLGCSYTREEWEKAWRVYLGLVTLLDDCVGEIVAALKNEGIYDDTLIIFTSDHGEMLGSHRLWQKMCMYEESTRTPFIFKLPKGVDAAVSEVDDVVSAVDVFPTLCELLGVKSVNKVSGVSLVGAFFGKPIHREDIFIQFDGNGGRGNFQRCVVRGDYKLIVDIYKDDMFFELYNVRDDVQETTNLAFGKPELVLDMLSSLAGYMQRTGDLLLQDGIKIEEDAYRRFVSEYGKHE